MTEKRLIILLICLIGLLLIIPIHAKEVTAKVDDKGLMWIENSRGGVVGTLHTCYGEITVSTRIIIILWLMTPLDMIRI